MKFSMKAMILAAGRGERLRPLTLTTPKPILPVGGVPIIHRTITLLKKYGFNDIVINLHHLGEQIERSLGDGSTFGVNIKYSWEKELLGTGGGIKAAQHLLGNEPFLVVNSDILIDINLLDLVNFHRHTRGAATLVVRDDPTLPGHGAIKIDDKHRIRDILGLVDIDNSGNYYRRLFVGVQVLEAIFFDYCEPDRWLSSTQDIFPRMLKDGLALYAYEHKGFFADIGTLSTYQKYLNMPTLSNL